MESLVMEATSESLTAEDWSLIIRLCEHAGNAEKSKEIIQSIAKRLSHKNVNVILYSLTLSNALVQNCSLSLRQEIASRPYLSVLLKLLANPKTHVIIKNRILDLIQAWAEAFRDENTLDFMGTIYILTLSDNNDEYCGLHDMHILILSDNNDEHCGLHGEIYRQLQSEGYQFPSQLPPSPKKVATISAKEKEEEEFQLAMAMSLSSQPQQRQSGSKNVSPPKATSLFQAKALYDFNPTEEGELKLRKGDLIEVLDNSTFADWWKGTYRGDVGIFPSNYVSTLESSSYATTTGMILDPNAELLQHLKSINDLKTMISKADPLGHNIAENERLQREYEKAVALVPLVLKRANDQRKKQDDLSSLHEKFTTACATYQGIMNSFAQFRQAPQPQQLSYQPQQPFHQSPYQQQNPSL